MRASLPLFSYEPRRRLGRGGAIAKLEGEIMTATAAATDTPADPPVERQLGFWMAAALVVGNIIGAGVFLLPASLAPFGANAAWGWLLTISGCLCLAVVLGLLAARIEGGPYEYVRSTMGDLPAFLVMWSYWVSIWGGSAALSIAFTSYLSSLVRAVGNGLAAPAVAIGALWAATFVNMRGPRAAGSLQLVTTTLKLLPLIAAMVVAALLLGRGEASAALVPIPVSPGGIASVAAMATFAMLGFECATLPAGKIRNPTRNVPLATVLGTLFAGLVTLAACLAVLFLLPGNVAATSAAPFADAIAPVLGPMAGSVVAAFAIVSVLGCLNGWVLCSGEVPLAMARAGIFPAWLGRTTDIGTPIPAQVLSSMVTTLLIVSNFSGSLAAVFTFVILVSTVSSLFLYVASAVAALKLRIGSVFALLGIAFAGFAFWGAGWKASLWGLALLAAGLPIYWLMRRASSRAATPAPAGGPAAPQGS
jgi:APA family basic amino acid/polyamine antiporter